MIAGSIYGVVLNDRDELSAFGDRLSAAPYNGAPSAPVVYIKPRMTVTRGGAPVPVPAGVPELTLSATIGVIFSRAASGRLDDPLAHVGAACLAIDVSEPESDYYRPAIRQRCRDAFLPLGAPCPLNRSLGGLTVVTHINGVERHRWSLDRLARPLEALISDLAAFMTFESGDMLLVGLPGDAPRAGVGANIRVEAAGFAPLAVDLIAGEIL